MFRLSRDVRFAIHPGEPDDAPAWGHNGYAGKPPSTGLGQCYYRLCVTVAGEPAADTGYVINIRTIDEAVREKALPLLRSAVRQRSEESGGAVLLACFRALQDCLQPHRLETAELHLSPFTSLATSAELASPQETPMVLLHHMFEFAASHRLHNPAFSDEENQQAFGKCNNPHGHGHNYVLRVTLRGRPEGQGALLSVEELERIVDERVIEPFDHRHLNLEIPEFAELNPSVENIARVVFDKLAAPLDQAGGRLEAVTVWETPKTWCEYRPDQG
jgi:6-pyruvoyltetrahydropterin/6-carboxytetrahydropterin synthase